MALIKRVSRLITADVHAVLDQLEEPEAVLRQAIREMEEELAKQEQRGRWKAAEVEATAGRIDALDHAIRELDSKLDLCFEEGNDALARRLVRRKLEAARLRDELTARRDTLTRGLAEHEAGLARNRDELEGMRQKASILCPPVASGNAGNDPLRDIDEADVDVAFMAEKRARAGS